MQRKKAVTAIAATILLAALTASLSIDNAAAVKPANDCAKPWVKFGVRGWLYPKAAQKMAPLVRRPTCGGQGTTYLTWQGWWGSQWRCVWTVDMGPNASPRWMTYDTYQPGPYC